MSVSRGYKNQYHFLDPNFASASQQFPGANGNWGDGDMAAVHAAGSWRDQFGAALAAVPPVAGVADMLAAMMGGAASARPAFPGWPAPANGPPAVPPAGTAAVTPAVAAEVPVGTVPAEAEPGESEPPSRRRRAAKAKAKRAAKPAAKKAAAKKAAAKKVKKPAKGRKDSK